MVHAAASGGGGGGRGGGARSHRPQLAHGEAPRQRRRSDEVHEANAHGLGLKPASAGSRRIVRRAAMDVLAQQDVEATLHGRHQRGRLGVGTSDAESDGILVSHARLDVDQKRRDDRVCDTSHRRSHYPHEREDGVITEDRLGRRHAGNETGDLLAEHAVARPGSSSGYATGPRR